MGMAITWSVVHISGALQPLRHGQACPTAFTAVLDADDEGHGLVFEVEVLETGDAVLTGLRCDAFMRDRNGEPTRDLVKIMARPLPGKTMRALVSSAVIAATAFAEKVERVRKGESFDDALLTTDAARARSAGARRKITPELLREVAEIVTTAQEDGRKDYAQAVREGLPANASGDLIGATTAKRYIKAAAEAGLITRNVGRRGQS